MKQKDYGLTPERYAVIDLDAQRREQEAHDQAQQRERKLQEQIRRMERELGKAEGELNALKASKPKGFWARLLGGE